MGTDRARVGVVHMEYDDVVEGVAHPGEGSKSASGWGFADPNVWSSPVETVVAVGSGTEADGAIQPQAVEGIVKAACSLDGRVDFVIGGCGFFWLAGQQLVGSNKTATMLSALDLLDVALKMTSRPIGVLTYSETITARLLQDHPARDRIRILGLDDNEAWAALSLPNYGERGNETKADLEPYLRSQLGRAMKTGGIFEEIGVLILECTILPDYRPAIRSMTPLPILDIVSFGKAILS